MFINKIYEITPFFKINYKLIINNEMYCFWNFFVFEIFIILKFYLIFLNFHLSFFQLYFYKKNDLIY